MSVEQGVIHEKAAVGFDRAGDAYDRGRPDYPGEAVESLLSSLGIGVGATVVELGAGTGKFTKLLLTSVPSGTRVVAVEPVPGMRKKFQSLLPHVEILDGTAERIPMATESVNAVIAAQAFHWFNGPAALREIHRVLKPNGLLGLIWNVRDEAHSWVAELTKIIDRNERGAPRYKSGEWKNAFRETSLFSPLEFRQLPYIQKGTVETIVDRVGSISFISAMPDAERARVLEEVRELVSTHPDTRGNTEIHLPYRTEIFWCRKQA